MNFRRSSWRRWRIYKIRAPFLSAANFIVGAHSCAQSQLKPQLSTFTQYYKATIVHIKQLLDSATQQLAAVSDSARLDAELLLAHALNKSRTYLFTWPQHEVDHAVQKSFAELLANRLTGQPVAHLIGAREFWSLNLQVTADTLIPRPETELLVETALVRLPKTKIEIADLGTGSGAIALALASECPLWKITATDKSLAALTIAQRNAQRLNITNIEFIHSDWFAVLSAKKFHAIISNPPYVADNDAHLAQGDVRFEPLSALTSGADGLDDIRLLAQQAGNYLLAGGLLLVEHGYDQMLPVKTIFQENHFSAIEQLMDLNGKPRATLGVIGFTSG